MALLITTIIITTTMEAMEEVIQEVMEGEMEREKEMVVTTITTITTGIATITITTTIMEEWRVRNMYTVWTFNVVQVETHQWVSTIMLYVGGNSPVQELEMLSLNPALYKLMQLTKRFGTKSFSQ